MHVIKNSENGYLNLRIVESKKTLVINDNEEKGYYRTIFSEGEIEEFKQDENLCIDWDKVELEEV